MEKELYGVFYYNNSKSSPNEFKIGFLNPGEHETEFNASDANRADLATRVFMYSHNCSRVMLLYKKVVASPEDEAKCNIEGLKNYGKFDMRTVYDEKDRKYLIIEDTIRLDREKFYYRKLDINQTNREIDMLEGLKGCCLYPEKVIKAMLED